MEDKMNDVFSQVSRRQSYDELTERLNSMSTEDLKKILEQRKTFNLNGDRIDETFPQISRIHSYEEFAKKLDSMSLEELRKIIELGNHDYTYVENPNKDKVNAYTDEYGVRLGMFIDDRDKGRGR